MILTTEEQRAEAARLLDLDEHGRQTELVALALRIGDQQEAAMAEIVRLDREFIEELQDAGRSEGGLPLEETVEGPGG